MSTRQNTLIILIPGFPHDEADTSCLPAQQATIKAIKALYPELELVVLAFQYPHRSDPYLWHGIRVIPLNGRNRGGPYRLLTWLRVWRAYRKLIRQVHVIGILSCWLNECALIGRLLAKRQQVPQLIWLLGQDALPGNRYARLIRPPGHVLAAISDRLAEIYSNNYGIRPAHIIPNGIDPELFSDVRGARDIDVLGVGSLIGLKQYDLFIDIIAAVSRHFPGLRVILCGDGPQKEHLLQQVRDRGLEHTISLTGELKHEKVLAAMQRSKILLHTSSYEGFSGACLEALYAGAHVVSFFAPMHAWIRHWHVAGTTDDAIEQLKKLLSTDGLDHSSTLPYPIGNTAAGLVRALGYPFTNPRQIFTS